MKLSRQDFVNWEQKSITLLGMSGVGKTRLACMLRNHHWFHFSADYRIGTRYLDEAITDNIKQQCMGIPLLFDLLRSDSIHLAANISIDNLAPLSTFLGKVGNPELGGLALGEFKRRQALHREAEVAAMLDVPEFIGKAQDIYGYGHFINDASGSLCELEDREVLECLAKHTLILYIKASEQDEAELIARAERYPKPLYYQESFLQAHLDQYMQDNAIEYAALIDPDDFVRWVFPRLFYARIPRYEAIAKQYGYVVEAGDVALVDDEPGFLELVQAVLPASVC